MKCKHCGARIVRTNDWAGRPSWTHQPAGAAFMDYRHEFCHQTTAEPAEEPRPLPEDFQPGIGERLRLPEHPSTRDTNRYHLPIKETP